MSLSQKLDEWIFGSIVGMADADLWIAFGISLLAVLLLAPLARMVERKALAEDLPAWKTTAGEADRKGAPTEGGEAPPEPDGGPPTGEPIPPSFDGLTP